MSAACFCRALLGQTCSWPLVSGGRGEEGGESPPHFGHVGAMNVFGEFQHMSSFLSKAPDLAFRKK